MVATTPRAASSGSRSDNRIDRRSAQFGWRMMGPALLVVALVTLVPIAYSVALSFTKTSVLGGSIQYEWIGIDNYIAVLSSPRMHRALSFTALYTALGVSLQMVLGYGIALVLDRMARGRPLVLAMLLIPYSMITVIAGHLWSYIFNGVYGVANYLLMRIGLIPEPVSWLSSPAGAIGVTVFADTWKTLPFVTLILLAGMQSFDRSLLEAARIDGAGFFRTQFSIVVPILSPAIATAMIFRILQSFGVFDLPFVLTRGGPGDSTVSVAMLAYNVAFQSLNMGAASTVTAITTLIVLGISLVFLRVFRRQVDGDA